MNRECPKCGWCRTQFVRKTTDNKVLRCPHCGFKYLYDGFFDVCYNLDGTKIEEVSSQE